MHVFSSSRVIFQISWCDGDFQQKPVKDFSHMVTKVLNVEVNFIFFLADKISYFVRNAL